MTEKSSRRSYREDAVSCRAVLLTNIEDGFHRCYACGEYPELAGPVAIEVSLGGNGFNWGFCCKCVRAMFATLEEGEKSLLKGEGE
jgi:hypothetical protein